VVGRKNWLFFDQPGGTEAGGVLYSLIESAKANSLEPYQYLCYIFAKLPQILPRDGDDQLKLFLPHILNRDDLEAHQKEYRCRGERH
jgi:hypothetical protein